jgi:hypothetical protein
MSVRRLSVSLSKVRSARVSFDVVWSALIAIGNDNNLVDSSTIDLGIASFIQGRLSFASGLLVSKPI